MSTGTASQASVRVRIEGRVQGVGYRAFVERQAAALGIAGWVRNRRDGTVEASFHGSVAAVDAMIDHCRTGPRGSSVTKVDVARDDASPPPGFTVHPTA